MRVRELTLCLALSLSPLAALAASVPEELPADSRIKTMLYDEYDVYTLPTKYSYQTNVVFGPGEEIQTISVGDRSLWQIIPSGNRLFIRPMEENVHTNMTVLTDRHSYQFDLVSVAENKDNNIYVAKFIYPDKRAAAMKAEPVAIAPATPAAAPAPAPAPAASAPVAAPDAATYSIPQGAIAGPGVTEPVNPNYNYSFSGPDELAPVQVYDDGKSTYFKYRNPYQPLPNAYMVDAQGKERIATVYQRDKVMMIDAVAPTWLLKNSNGTVTIYNEMLNPK